MNLESLEQNARRAKTAMSFSEYKQGSASAEYAAYCRDAEEIAQKAIDRLKKHNAPEDRIDKVNYLLVQYKAKKLTWLNDIYANRAKVPSMMIAGGSNFPVRRKEKQNAKEDALYAQNPDYILDKIRGIGNDAKTIYSDEADAVKRIKAKIESLKDVSDPYGNKSAEVRRLKERLLTLAPEEFAEQQAAININGAKTYTEIVALWDTGKKTTGYTGDRFYWELYLVFTDGKRKYKEWLQIEIDESGENMQTFNTRIMKGESTPLTNEQKYNLIISKIHGSGNKAVIYKHLDSLSPQTDEVANEATGEGLDTVEINGETAEVIRNKEAMRLQLIFDGKPSDDVRNKLKTNGFRWAPSCAAWQRLLNDNAEYALKRIIS